MIKKLRFKFILASLLSVLFVIGTTIGVINLHNFRKVERDSSKSLTLILEKGFQDFPDDPPPPPESRAQDPHEPQEMPKNELMGQDYFLVSFKKDGTVDQSDFKHIFTVSDDQGLQYAFDVFKNGSKEGKISTLRYQTMEKDDLTYVAFLDLELKLNEAKSFFVSSIIISSISYVVLAGLIFLASFIVFKPSEESYKKQKQFITNASHELKTPLTIISTDVELVEMDNGKSEWTESIKDQVNRLTKMTNQLVTLSKMDEVDYKNFVKEDFSLSEVANQCLDTFSPLFVKQSLTLKYDIEENVTYFGNKESINELLHIFLENSLKYTKDNGNVFASLTKNKNHVTLFIKNDVKENSNIDTKQLFDRFYRGSDTSKNGSGIGLSIAKEIVRAHKGEIKAKLENNELGFEIIL